MTSNPLPRPAESGLSDVRQYLTPSCKIYTSYVHLLRSEQEVQHEYCNVSDGVQRVTVILVTSQGQILQNSSPKIYELQSQEILSIDSKQWVRSTGADSFSGQIFLIIDQITSHGATPILPAITAHWMSPIHHSKVATAAFDHLNLRSFQRKRSFYMYCSMTVSDDRRSTWVVLFNHSTDPEYDDSGDVYPTLYGKSGQALVGQSLTIAPFGALILDVSQHFGAAGAALFSQNQGKLTLTLQHQGHTFPAYFFHVDPKTQDILSAQHAQPSIAAFTHFGIWWGKLRQFGF
jgi:hypothetical protein